MTANSNWTCDSGKEKANRRMPRGRIKEGERQELLLEDCTNLPRVLCPGAACPGTLLGQQEREVTKNSAQGLLCLNCDHQQTDPMSVWRSNSGTGLWPGLTVTSACPQVNFGISGACFWVHVH